MSSGDFGQIDLAPEQRDSRAVLLRLMDELETVAGGPRAAAEDANDEARIERRQLFQSSRPVIGDLEEFRPLGFGQAGETADDRVVDELRDRFRAQAPFDVRIEDLEEIEEAVGGGVGAKFSECLERGDVGVDVVGEGDRIEPEVGERPDVRQRSGAERPRRRVMKGPATMAPDIGRVVGADRGLDPCAGEGAALRELLQVGGRRQHDVDDILFDDRFDRIEKFRPGGQPRPRATRGPRRADRMQPRPHVGVLGVGDDEIRAPVGACADARELVVEPDH